MCNYHSKTGGCSLPTIWQPLVASRVSGHLAAIGSKGTLSTLGVSGGADLSSKEHDSMAEVAALFRGEDLTELLLHFFWFFSNGKSQPSTDADAVSIANYAARYAINISKDQVGGLSADTGQL